MSGSDVIINGGNRPLGVSQPIFSLAQLGLQRLNQAVGRVKFLKRMLAAFSPSFKLSQRDRCLRLLVPQ
jgi:hypothetical protein